jgi:hypothetical protein
MPWFYTDFQRTSAVLGDNRTQPAIQKAVLTSFLVERH